MVGSIALGKEGSGSKRGRKSGERECVRKIGSSGEGRGSRGKWGLRRGKGAKKGGKDWRGRERLRKLEIEGSGGREGECQWRGERDSGTRRREDM